MGWVVFFIMAVFYGAILYFILFAPTASLSFKTHSMRQMVIAIEMNRQSKTGSSAAPRMINLSHSLKPCKASLIVLMAMIMRQIAHA